MSISLGPVKMEKVVDLKSTKMSVVSNPTAKWTAIESEIPINNLLDCIRSGNNSFWGLSNEDIKKYRYLAENSGVIMGDPICADNEHQEDLTIIQKRIGEKIATYSRKFFQGKVEGSENMSFKDKVSYLLTMVKYFGLDTCISGSAFAIPILLNKTPKDDELQSIADTFAEEFAEGKKELKTIKDSFRACARLIGYQNFPLFSLASSISKILFSNPEFPTVCLVKKFLDNTDMDNLKWNGCKYVLEMGEEKAIMQEKLSSPGNLPLAEKNMAQINDLTQKITLLNFTNEEQGWQIKWLSELLGVKRYVAERSEEYGISSSQNAASMDKEKNSPALPYLDKQRGDLLVPRKLSFNEAIEKELSIMSYEICEKDRIIASLNDVIGQKEVRIAELLCEIKNIPEKYQGEFVELFTVIQTLQDESLSTENELVVLKADFEKEKGFYENEIRKLQEELARAKEFCK